MQKEPLLLRSTPKKDATKANIITRLLDGQIVRAFGTKIVNGLREVESSLNGAPFRGFAWPDILKSAPDPNAVPIVTQALAPPTSGIIAVTMPCKAGTVIKRTDPRTAHSLNEANQPGHAGTPPDGWCAEIAAIVDWLTVDKPTHRRYQPTTIATFCNIHPSMVCWSSEMAMNQCAGSVPPAPNCPQRRRPHPTVYRL